jgi:cell wall-associated NlpC family hydrolase
MQKRFALLFVLLLTTLMSQSYYGLAASMPDDQPSSSSVVDRATLIAFAKKYLGIPYHTAGSSPQKGFDCSGFVNFVFSNFHINVPRSSRDFKNAGTTLKPEEFKEGDVVVFYSFRNKARIGHVGIICEANGLKSKFIHSESGHKKGIVVSHLGSPTYAKRFFKCVDVIDKK